MRCETAPPGRCKSRSLLWRMTAHRKAAVRLKRVIAARGLANPTSIAGSDQEPTSQTWTDLAHKKGCLWIVLGLRSWLRCELLDRRARWVRDRCPIECSPRDQLQAAGFAAAARTDGEPVPKPVWREAYIEYAWANFISCLRRMARRGSGSHGSSFASSRRSITGRCSEMLALPPIKPAGMPLP